MLRGQRRSAVLARRSRGSGLVPLHGRVVFYGDGIASEGAAPGDANAPIVALALMNGRVRGAVGWMQAKSGGDMDTTFARRDHTAAQKADLVVLTSMGHNPETDGSGTLLSADPASSPVLFAKWKRNVQYQFDNLAPAARMVVWTTCYSTGIEPYRVQVTAAQQAFIATLGARVTVFNAHAVFDPVTMANDGIHPNQLGGIALGTALAAVLDTVVTPASRDAILADTGASDQHGPNLDTDWAMTGTSGSKVGTLAPVGSYAAGKAITNSLVNGTGVAITCTKDAAPGSYERQVVQIAGTPAARNTISQSDTGTIALTGTGPGDYVEMLCECIIDDGAGGPPIGLHSWGAAPGSFGQLSNSGVVANYSADRVSRLDIVVRTPPLPIFGTSGAGQANPAVTTRWSQVALTGRTILSRPILRRIEIAAYAVPYYMGNDALTASNHLCRITGTATVGSTLRGDPGKWSGGAIGWAARAWYRDGAAIPGATDWTYVVQAADSGHVLTFGPNPANAYGSETVTRSAGVTIA